MSFYFSFLVICFCEYIRRRVFKYLNKLSQTKWILKTQTRQEYKTSGRSGIESKAFSEVFALRELENLDVPERSPLEM